MNIVFQPEADLHFKNYGVEIPIVDDRAMKVFNELKKHDENLSYFDILDIPKITKEDLLLCHDKIFVEELYKSDKSLEFQLLKAYELIDNDGNYQRYNPKSAKKNILHAFETILLQVGLTYISTKNALKSGFSYFLGGGMHHAMSFSGRGFCLVNDIIITLKKLQNEGLIKTAWVIDVDAHKGDGTRELTKRDSSIVTLSIHMKEGWPLNSGSVRDPWFIPSNVEIGIDCGEEGIYLKNLEDGLNELKNNYPLPEIALIVNGADPFEYDELPSTELLKLTKEQLLARDQLVYNFLCDLKIPQSYVMAGGYGKRSWEIYFQFLEFVRKRSP